GLVDQGGGVERLPERFLGELVGGQLTQIVVDQRQQLLSGLAVVLLDGLEDRGDLVYGPDCNPVNAREQRPSAGRVGGGATRTSPGPRTPGTSRGPGRGSVPGRTRDRWLLYQISQRIFWKPDTRRGTFLLFPLPGVRPRWKAGGCEHLHGPP